MDVESARTVSIFTLTSIASFFLLITLLDPDLNRSARLLARARAFAPGRDARGATSDNARRQSVESLLKEVDGAQGVSRMGMADRIRQAGLRWTLKAFLGVCGAVSCLCFLVAYCIIGLPGVAVALFAPGVGLALPWIYIERRRRRRFAAFATEFPNAVDIIVRGIKSGLCVSDCLRIISTEAKEPVCSEFRQIVEDQTMGLPLADAVQRLPRRMPTAEAKFFAIVVSIQARSGGSLAEALGNLSKVLRDRKKMESKVKAMSAEAKASASIIASLPPAVAGLMYLTSPAYVSILFTEPTGHLVMLASAVWMATGVLVMRKMIHFDF